MSITRLQQSSMKAVFPVSICMCVSLVCGEFSLRDDYWPLVSEPSGFSGNAVSVVETSRRLRTRTTGAHLLRIGTASVDENSRCSAVKRLSRDYVRAKPLVRDTSSFNPNPRESQRISSCTLESRRRECVQLPGAAGQTGQHKAFNGFHSRLSLRKLPRLPAGSRTCARGRSSRRCPTFR